MTTRAAPEPESGVPGQILIVALAVGLGFIAGAAFGQPWAASDQPERRAINPAPVNIEVDAGYPLAPSEGFDRGPLTPEEVAAQHETLIDAWLSQTG